MIFAACVGYTFESRKSLPKGTLDPIKYDVFNREYDQTIIDMIAFSETDDHTVMDSRVESYDAKFAIFEEYANAGLEIMRRKVIDSPGAILDNMIDFVYEGKKGHNEDPVSILKLIGENI